MATINVPLAFQADRRDVARFPEALLSNLFAESAPSSLSKGVALLPRPGYSLFSLTTDFPHRGAFQQAGTLDGDLLVLSGITLYRVTSAGAQTVLGLIPGTELASFASDGTTVRIAVGNALYKTDGLTVTFDDSDVCSIVYLRGFWFSVRTSTQIVYYLLPGDVAWDPLQFISAESLPDKMVAIGLIGDQMAFLGDTTLEVWALTAGSTPPAEPYGGLNFKEKGCLNRSTLAEIDNGLVWVASDKAVYISRGGVPERISTHGVEERIAEADSTTLRAWHYTWDGHKFYVLTMGEQGTWVYDFATQLWTTFKSLGQASWRGALGAQAEWGTVACDDVTGALWLLSDDDRTDGGEPIERLWTALYEHHERTMLRCDRLVLTASVGWAQSTGQGSEPLVEMRQSNDYGMTFGSWKQRSMGRIGDFFTQVVWKALGAIRRPGRVFQFRCTDPIITRVSNVEMEGG